jgi:hypothetical protein
MWLSANIAHYAPEQPRVLIDGNPARAPWIDLDDLRARGAVVVWVAGDPDVLPPIFRAVAGDAEIQPPLTLPLHLGAGVTQVGWALLRPRPVPGAGRKNNQAARAHSTAAIPGECPSGAHPN